MLQIVGLLLLVSASIFLVQWKFDSDYLRTMFSLYIFWTFTIIIRGFTFDYQSLKFMLFDSTFGIMLYFAPFILLFPRNLAFYKKAFDVLVILGIAYLLYDFIFLKDLLAPGRNLRSQAILEYFSQNLSLPCGLLLITYIYHTKKSRLLALSVIVLTFLLAAIRARRGLMFISINILIFSFLIYFYVHKVKIIVFIFSLILISSVYLIGAKIYNENKHDLFGYVTARLDENTRTGVEAYFYKDMNLVSWTIGKGINGLYYCPGIDGSESGLFTINRGVIETGYLQLILKGGIISLGLLLLIAIPAVFKGIFYSKNILSKAAGIWVLLFLISLYPSVPVNFSMGYLLVWISIAICYSDEIREMPDTTVSELLSH